MKKRAFIFALALAMCLALSGCLEQPEPVIDETGHSEPIADIAVVSDGSLTAVVVDKADDGITLEITNSGNENTVSATFTSAKMGGREYQINQPTYSQSPLSIMRYGEETKTVNLTLPANDFARVKVSRQRHHNQNQPHHKHQKRLATTHPQEESILTSKNSFHPAQPKSENTTPRQGTIFTDAPFFRFWHLWGLFHCHLPSI